MQVEWIISASRASDDVSRTRDTVAKALDCVGNSLKLIEVASGLVINTDDLVTMAVSLVEGSVGHILVTLEPIFYSECLVLDSTDLVLETIGSISKSSDFIISSLDLIVQAINIILWSPTSVTEGWSCRWGQFHRLNQSLGPSKDQRFWSKHLHHWFRPHHSIFGNHSSWPDHLIGDCRPAYNFSRSIEVNVVVKEILAFDCYGTCQNCCQSDSSHFGSF